MSKRHHDDLKKICFWLTISVLLAMFVLTPLNIASLSDHECVCSCGTLGSMHCTCGDICSICALISHFSSFIRSAVSVLALFALVHIMASMLHIATIAAENAQNDSPVKLKVKLSN